MAITSAETPPSAIVAGRPRLGFVGPMLGVNPGWVTSQGELLAELLTGAGYQVQITSHRLQRLPRLMDILGSLVAWRNEIDVVIHQVFSGPAFAVTDAASALCRTLGLPQVFALHGGALPEFAAEHGGWVRRVLRRAEAIVTPSTYLAQTFAADPDLVARIHTIPNILEIENYSYRHRPSVDPQLLWMRTFHEIYHPQMAVEVLAELRQTHPEATLTMAGQEKGLHATVQTLAQQRGLSAAVRFPGFLGPQDKAREFAGHDIYLNTNHVDNMPVSVLEACAFGLPVVATAVGGVPHLLRDGETGLLVPDGDVAAMAGAVRRLLDEPELAGALSANGRRLAESCAWEPVKARWEALFAEVIHA
ncbi:MAG: glycosyltransferase family 4 protein [Candidatus Promineofilum sp.]|nr:glycosyltransferase family 4 protein [Promineifilum sp.]